jgi:NADP-dependent 3-hydroxy acid dehydrogenase YdfG
LPAVIGIIGRGEQHLKRRVAAISAFTSSTKADYAVAEITVKSTLQAAFDHFASKFEKIDVSVSNAGHLSNVAAIDDSDDEDWREGSETNTKRSCNAIRAFLPQAALYAVVLDANTGLATWHSIPGLSSYSSSKIASAKLFEHPQVGHPDSRVVKVHLGVVEMAMMEKTRVTANDYRKFCGNETWTLY